MSGDPFQMALTGSSRLLDLLSSGTASITAVAESGMYKGHTLLHCAAAKGHMELASALVSRGASTSATDKKGRTPADVAQAAGHGQLAAALRHPPAACRWWHGAVAAAAHLLWARCASADNVPYVVSTTSDDFSV